MAQARDKETQALDIKAILRRKFTYSSLILTMVIFPATLAAFAKGVFIPSDFDPFNDFGDSYSWSYFDLGASGSSGIKSFHDGVFDGRYIYFAPGWDGDGLHGKVARYDTASDFWSSDSWSVFDFEIPLFGGTSGPIGAVFDGRHVYFVPNMDDTLVHNGRVMRYDTAMNFLDPASWSMYDAGATSGLDTKGYMGAVFDGRYLYFSPHRNGGGSHANVLRYDTAGHFESPESWTAYDAGATGDLNTKGYGAPVFDGRYVYFSPNKGDEVPHGYVLRFDTTGNFTSPASWTAYDAGDTGGLNTKECGGFGNSIFDGRFIYLGGCGGRGYFLCHDTTGDFLDPGSWSAFDASNAGGLTDTVGYKSAAVFDGRFIYYAPYGSHSSHHGKVLRHDTAGNFTSPGSWSAFDATAINADAKGYNGAVFDGRYVYFVPDDNVDHGVGPHGIFLRFDTGFARKNGRRLI